ncbi:hypothetical protein GCM10009730_03090 [Streptomyces albidochromogenes]|uniref:hypothetical protein n=1 Tax=Streptomyces albidochromogenes TaxID=329524 RepID=UPI00110FBEFB|nr:hypothetical protein [Streptomyces albidochromogenes]
MADARMWSIGPAGEAATWDDGLVSLLGRAGGAEPGERVVSAPVVCRHCDWNQFEVAAGECYCEGCCLPLGIEDGDVVPGAPMWRLVPSDAPLPPVRAASLTAADMVRCPAGHDLFEVGVAYELAGDGGVRRLSVGLRCPLDGASRLYVDNACVVPRACCP